MRKGFKLFSVLVIAVLMVSMMSATAFAHGGHGRGRHGGHGWGGTGAQPWYGTCTVDDCAEIGLHQHEDSWYCCQFGHTGDYAVCSVNDCAELGLHEHEGAYYYCQDHGTAVGCGRGRNR